MMVPNNCCPIEAGVEILEQGFIDLWTRPGDFLQFDPLVITFLFATACALASYVVMVATGNCSWVDRLWSIVPPVYSWMLSLVIPVIQGAEISQRAIIMSLLQTLWGMRLTYNFYRKDGYNLSSEDYRWEAVRNLSPPLLWEFFRFFFISLTQMYIIWDFSATPTYIASQGAHGLTAFDIILVFMFVWILATETIADQQQWNFQEAKKKESHLSIHPPEKSSIEIASGFVSTGLFRYSRHPNFFCEILLWWTMYLFSVPATGCWINFSGLGAVHLTLLFLGSTTLTEYLTSQKYPLYQKYQKQVSRFIPFPSNFDIRDYQ